MSKAYKQIAEGGWMLAEDYEVLAEDGVILIAKDDLSEYYNYFLPTVLRCDKKTDTGKYLPYNFDECKGVTFERVIIFPNGPFKDFLLKGKVLKCPQKYYVAATRANYSIAFVLDKLLDETDKWKHSVHLPGQNQRGQDIIAVLWMLTLFFREMIRNICRKLM